MMINEALEGLKNDIIKTLDEFQQAVKSSTGETAAEVIYLKPKSGKNRVYNFVKAEFRDSSNERWINGVLIAYDYTHKLFHNFKCGGMYRQCRIPMFGPEKPPPVDTLVVVNYDPKSGVRSLRYFSHFDETGRISCFKVRETSKTQKNTILWGDYSFVDFPESDYEIWEG